MAYQRKPIPPKQRSAVTNGRMLFLNGYDGRSLLARRFADIVEQFTADLGGDPSAAEGHLIRRVAMLCVICEQMEGEYVADGKDLSPTAVMIYTTISNSLNRLLNSIGLKRVPRDVTPSLASVQKYMTLEALEQSSDGLEAVPGAQDGQSHTVNQVEASASSTGAQT